MTTHAERPPAHQDGAATDDAGGVSGEIRAFWDEDAAGYDASPSHYPQRPQEQAAWAAALRRLLPEPPAAVLDIGAGTGFLSLLLAGQGYDVTAADLSPGMLGRLRTKAAERGLSIRAVEADALDPPAGDFDAVVERHLLWTLPDPGAALAAWHKAAPRARLVLIEGTWALRTRWARSSGGRGHAGWPTVSGAQSLTITAITATGCSEHCRTATA